MCQNFASPFAAETFVSEIRSHIVPAPHHLIVFSAPDIADGGPLEPCSPAEFRDLVFGTQIQDDSVAFPEGVGMRIGATGVLRVQVHWLNTGSEPVKTAGTLTFQPAAGKVDTEAGVLVGALDDIQVPPHAEATLRPGNAR